MFKRFIIESAPGAFYSSVSTFSEALRVLADALDEGHTQAAIIDCEPACERNRHAERMKMVYAGISNSWKKDDCELAA